MEIIPGVLIVSCSNTKPKSLIKLITGNVNVVEEENGIGKISCPWKIDTKYYTAKVTLHGIDESFVRTEQFNESIEALIILMNSNVESGLDDIQRWLCIDDECQPEVKLLVSNYCTDQTKITKSRAMEWCLKQGFELIELYPTVDKTEDEIEDDDLSKEKTGVDRIIEALEAHTWSNLVMKGRKNEKSIAEVSDLEEVDSNCHDFLTNEGFDNFTELFSQLSMMKDSIQSMSGLQQQRCAEQMVTAFWRAIGGDEEEIGDL